MTAAALVQRLRIAWYRRLWSAAEVRGRPQLRSPAVLAGAGTVTFHGEVIVGWEQGPGFLSGYSYVEARNPGAEIAFGEGTHLNNGVTVVSEQPGISIGRRCVIGPGVHIYDSDFHSLDAVDGRAAPPARGRVEIGDDVFLGTNAIVLKGVTIGTGSSVGAGAVVAEDVAPHTVVAGNPARPVGR